MSRAGVRQGRDGQGWGLAALSESSRVQRLCTIGSTSTWCGTRGPLAIARYVSCPGKHAAQASSRPRPSPGPAGDFRRGRSVRKRELSSRGDVHGGQPDAVGRRRLWDLTSPMLATRCVSNLGDDMQNQQLSATQLRVSLENSGRGRFGARATTSPLTLATRLGRRAYGYGHSVASDGACPREGKAGGAATAQAGGAANPLAA